MSVIEKARDNLEKPVSPAFPLGNLNYTTLLAIKMPSVLLSLRSPAL